MWLIRNLGLVSEDEVVVSDITSSCSGDGMKEERS